MIKILASVDIGLPATSPRVVERQSGSHRRAKLALGCHSGIAGLARSSGVLAVLTLAGPGAAQAAAAAFEVVLRDGRVLAATSIRGDLDAGLDVNVDQGGPVRIDAGDLLAVLGSAVAGGDLASVWLAGGDVLYGAIVGGDAAGDRLEFLSPVLGRVALPVDRVAAVAAPDCREPLALTLPAGVAEGLFRRAAIGFDLVAGSLHQFGDQGVRFAPEGVEPRWFGAHDFAALRIADPTPRAVPPRCDLLTRAGDRLGVRVRAFTADGVQCELENGALAVVRLGDLACLAFRGVGTFLSDLAPIEVTEHGYDGEVVLPWAADRSALGGPLQAGGHAYRKGLGVHSQSRLVFRAPADAQSFWTRVAIDDSVGTLNVRPDCDVRVVVDGKVRFEKKGLAPAAGPVAIGPFAVAPGASVALEVDFGRGRDLGDRVDWLLPLFVTAPGKRP